MSVLHRRMQVNQLVRDRANAGETDATPAKHPSAPKRKPARKSGSKRRRA